MGLPLLPTFGSHSGRPLLYTITALTSFGFTLIGYDNVSEWVSRPVIYRHTGSGSDLVLFFSPFFLVGSQGVMGGIINNPPFKTTFDNPSASLVGTIVAIYEAGAAIGSLLCAAVGEHLGRRWSLMLGAILMLGGTGFQAGVSSSGALIGARIVSGLGMGFLNSTNPVLQSESSPKSNRGVFICFLLSMLNLGIMLAYWVGYGFTEVGGSKAWRVPVALQAIFIIPIIVLLFFVPESPRWLAAHGREDEALRVLSRLAGKPEDDPMVREQHQEILVAARLQAAVGSGTWSDLLREDEFSSRKRLLIACSIQFFQQIGGINALNYYATNLVLAAGENLHNASLVSGGLFTWFFLASFIPWFLIDRVGRRKLLLVTITAMACCFAIEAGCVSAVQRSNSRAAGAVAVAVLFVYLGLFTIGFQAVVWVYPSEVLPLRLRQRGSAISTFCNWITNFAIVEMTPPALKNIGYKFYIIFAVINASFLPIIYIFYPETAGMSLESIDALFKRDGPALGETAKRREMEENAKAREIVEREYQATSGVSRV
ncbi:putative hexose carrier protein [Kockovaella imperatae]|uniref:Putative hexose carrier protein n=1 Tax=Kockovaella imperatae TaxID=4999 RepID=A0A1Y1UP28_9TREE|nr:putative hexose carrier protein [Kockovaella imperatae]ORX39791.1 putative hexose carrier protein [Kockovaella imperatae]